MQVRKRHYTRRGARTVISACAGSGPAAAPPEPAAIDVPAPRHGPCSAAPGRWRGLGVDGEGLGRRRDQVQGDAVERRSGFVCVGERPRRLARGRCDQNAEPVVGHLLAAGWHRMSRFI